MIVIFGKGKVGNWISHLLTVLNTPHVLMDDQDLDPSILNQAEFVLVSPGIKQSHVVYQQYWAKIKSELNFLASILPSIGFVKKPTWIGITATNGKSTTTWIVYSLLKNLLPKTNVWITGNFDIPVSEILATIIENKQLDQEHIFVVECSSFMLYGLQNFVFDYGLFLNIATDHLDWHRDRDEYIASKFNLLKNTAKKALTSQHLYDQLDLQTQQHTKVFTPIFDLSKTQFLGSHNQENFAAATMLIQTYFDDHELVLDQEKLGHFVYDVVPLDHRLKLLRTVGWVAFYDDGISTSSQALHAALDAFYQPLVLLAWGFDKWDDYVWLHEDFVARVSFAILFGQTAYKFQAVCQKAHVPYIVVQTLHDAITQSYSYAKEHKIWLVLFSPWAASFDMFKNVYDRVGQFVHEVSILKD